MPRLKDPEDRERHAQYQREYREAKARAGLCIECGGPGSWIDPGKKICRNCLEKRVDRARKSSWTTRTDEQKRRKRKRDKEREAERVAAGLCPRCGRPHAEGRKMCIQCLKKGRSI